MPEHLITMVATDMKINQKHLQQAADSGILQKGQDEQLWAFLMQQQAGVAQFRASHLLYYFGGLLAISAMSLFMTLSHDYYGGTGLAVIALCYALLGFSLAEKYQSGNQPLLTGIFATFAIVQAPLFVFGVLMEMDAWGAKDYLRYYHWIDARWLWLELTTLLAGTMAFCRYRLPFLLMPLALTLWYMGMDLAPLILQDFDYNWQMRKSVAVVWGILTLGLAFYVDLRDKKNADFAFWLYLAGLMSFWGGLTLMDAGSELGKLLYALTNLALVTIGVAIGRRMFAVFGAIGIVMYLGHLAFDLFKDSNLFPLLLCFSGFGVIYLGILWQRHESRLAAYLQQHLPTQLQELAQRRR